MACLAVVLSTNDTLKLTCVPYYFAPEGRGSFFDSKFLTEDLKFDACGSGAKRVTRP